MLYIADGYNLKTSITHEVIWLVISRAGLANVKVCKQRSVAQKLHQHGGKEGGKKIHARNDRNCQLSIRGVLRMSYHRSMAVFCPRLPFLSHSQPLDSFMIVPSTMQLALRLQKCNSSLLRVSRAFIFELSLNAGNHGHQMNGLHVINFS